MKTLSFEDKVYFNQSIFESYQKFWKEKNALFVEHQLLDGQSPLFYTAELLLPEKPLLPLTKNRKEATWLVLGTIFHLILPYFIPSQKKSVGVFPAEPDTYNDFLPLDWEQNEKISLREILNRNKKQWAEVLQNQVYPIRVTHSKLQWNKIATTLTTFDQLHAFSEENEKDFPIQLLIQTTSEGFLCQIRVICSILEASSFDLFLSKFEKAVAVLCQNPDAILSEILIQHHILRIEDFEQKHIQNPSNITFSPSMTLLASVWQEVLGFSEISVEDNFFYIGGDSIKAIQIIVRLQKKGFRLELKDIFEYPTIRQQVLQLRPIELSPPTTILDTPYLSLVRALCHTKKIADNPIKAYPLSSTQVGIFFRARLSPDSLAYCEQISYRIQGSFEVEKWKESYEALVHRHDILRTSFWEDVTDIPLQIVWEKGTTNFTFENITHLSIQEQNSYIQTLKQEVLHQKYDFAYGALMRLYVFQINPQEWELIWSHHHILMDGWCLSILMEEFWMLYFEQHSSLSPVVPYQRYIHWLSQQDATTSLNYWKDYLSHYTETVGIPSEKLSLDYQHQSTTFSFSKEVSQEMQAICNQWQVTLSTFWQVLWGILLQRYNYSEDVVFGKIVSGRPTQVEGIEQMIGVFIQAIPCRIQTKMGQSIQEIVFAHQQTVIQQEEHLYTGLSEIQKLSPLRENLFNHLWIFENYPIASHFLKNEIHQAIKILNWDNYEQTEYDFNCLFFLKENALHIQFLYNGLLYSDEFVVQIFQHLHAFVTQITHNPTISIEALTLCEPDIRLDFLQNQFKNFKKWQFETIIPLLALQKFNIASSLFSTISSQSLTFAEVYQKSLQVSFFLSEIQKIPPTARIGVRTQRNESLLSVVLGIIQAGYVYIPLDSSYPETRQKHILEDAQCAFLMEEIPQMEEVVPQNFELPEIFPYQLAYLIYTSGSTGLPKGVCITHQNLANFVQWALEEWKTDDFEEILAGTSIGFDLSIFELIYGFCAGKNICLLASNHEISRQLHRKKILLNTVPSVLKYLADNAFDLQNVASINTAGEPIPLGLVRYFQQFPQIRLRNLYAPSETTTYSTCYFFPPNAAEISIGFPISNTIILIADRYGNSQPQGIVGEIWIGGEGVAEGYWQKTELTDEKFVNLSFDENSMPIPYYKTGDLGKWSSEKGLIFLNRADEQVKINGFRIELGEITTQLKKLINAHNCAVLAITPENNPQLVAFVETKEIDVTQLKAKLAEVLPIFMLPSVFLTVQTIPLTPNGKIDKKALIQIYHASVRVQSFQPTQNLKEQILEEIWQKLLNHPEPVSTQANFFQLGGDSIKAMQLIGNLRQKGYHLSLQSIYLNPTIEALQIHLTTSSSFEKHPQKTTTNSNFIPLSPIQRWFFENFKTAQSDDFTHFHHFNQSIWLKTEFRADSLSVEKTLQYLVQTHLVFHTSFYKNFENEIVAVRLKLPNPENWQVRSHQLSSLDLAVVEQEAQQSQKSLNISSGKWIQLTILDTPESTYWFFVIHHLVVDGVSWRIFLEDFWQVYQAILHSLPLPALYPSDSYASWVESLYRFFESEQATTSLEEWKNIVQFSDKPLLQFSETPCLYSQSKTIVAKLEKEATQALLKNIHIFFQTEINDILLTALLRAYQHLQPAPTFTLLLEGHGRETLGEQVEIIRTIGWFTSLFPVCLEVLEDDLSLQIRTVKETLRRIPQKGASYGIWKYLSIEKYFSAVHSPQIVFNYLGELDNVAYQGISIADLPNGVAVFPDAHRIMDMEWNLFVQNNELTVQLTYSAHSLEEPLMDKLLHHFIVELKYLIEFCQNQTETTYSPSDFGNAGLSLDDFDQIQKWIDGLE